MLLTAIVLLGFVQSANAQQMKCPLVGEWFTLSINEFYGEGNIKLEAVKKVGLNPYRDKISSNGYIDITDVYFEGGINYNLVYEKTIDANIYQFSTSYRDGKVMRTGTIQLKKSGTYVVVYGVDNLTKKQPIHGVRFQTQGLDFDSSQGNAQGPTPNEDNKIYDVVQDMPTFPGGTNSMIKYFSENIKYPEQAKSKGVKGRVLVNFVVEKDGRITDCKVVKSASPELDNEALRVVSSMPKWNPGKKDGQPVRVKFTIPISFAPQAPVKQQEKTQNNAHASAPIVDEDFLYVVEDVLDPETAFRTSKLKSMDNVKKVLSGYGYTYKGEDGQGISYWSKNCSLTNNFKPTAFAKGVSSVVRYKFGGELSVQVFNEKAANHFVEALEKNGYRWQGIGSGMGALMFKKNIADENEQPIYVIVEKAYAYQERGGYYMIIGGDL